MAVQWFEAAAAAGDPAAQFNLGVMYERGRGVERNLRQAARWFEKAALAGDLDALREIAWALTQGLG